jgi:SAM-dependent methyltransferase
MRLLIIGLIMSHSLFAAENISHSERQTTKQSLVEKIKERGDLPHVSMTRQLELLEELSEFDVGRFLIERGGLNGYWTHYAATYPEKKHQPKNALEAYLLNACPAALATQQRFQIFKSQIQQYVREGCCLASIPCGVMGDLLDLNYTGNSNFALYGIDLDAEALFQAKEYARAKNLTDHCHFLEKDAWQLKIESQFDLISSNGLSIYEYDDQKVVALYREFYQALKPNGVLITSFLTPPLEWLSAEVNPKDALLQKILFMDILNSKWQAYRKEETVKNQLKEAGFHSIEIVYDKAHVFPTVIAKK